MNKIFATLVALGLASCGEGVGEPITNQNNPDSGGGDTGTRLDSGTDGPTNSDSSDDSPDSGGGDTGTRLDSSTDGPTNSDGGDGGGSDGGRGNLPRLIVGASDHLSVWNNASGISTDRLHDVSINGGGLGAGISSIAAAAHRVFVGRKPTGGAAAIAIFDNADVMDSTATPAAVVNRGGDALNFMRADGANHLWVGDFSGISMFLGSSTLTSASTPAALFTHSFQQVPTCVFEPTSGRLFAGQISGAGVLAWNSAATKTGSPTNDFKLADGAYWGMAIAGNRLYAVGTHAGATSNGVAIWNGADNLTATTAPAVKLTNGYRFQIFIPDVAVRDDVLAVAARDDDKVMIYKAASAITTDQPPDVILTHAQMKAPSRVVFGPDGRLYILDRDGVLIYRDVKTTPTFVTEVTMGILAPVDIALVE